MARSPNNRFEVFEFREEDELVGRMDMKLQSRLSNPKFEDSPSLKYNFLACVAHGSDLNAKASAGVECVDVDSTDDDEHCSVIVPMQALTVPVENAPKSPVIGYNGVTDTVFEPSCQMSQNIYAQKSSISTIDNTVLTLEGDIPKDGHVKSPVIESPTNSCSVDSTISSHAHFIQDISCSSPDVSADERAEGHIISSLAVEEMDSVVALHADYVTYKGNYYPTSLVKFSNRSIKLESSVVDKDVETLMFEWAIDDDVVSIDSQWYARGSVVKVQIYVLAKVMTPTENLHDVSGTELLKVVLFDPEWFLSLEKIMSLNVRYKAVWKTLSTSDMVDDGDDLPVDKRELSTRPYFPDFDEQFDEVVYPEGDVDAVSISKRDIDMLQPETFINDTIVDFYIKYLKNKIPAAEICRLHFFNSFFFRKLADLDKNPDSVFDGKAAFQRVRKWTRKINLFEKDYIFIPVNYNLHWSLIVICHPGEVTDFTAEKMSDSSRVPCILHMDSIRGSHSGLKNLIQSYLLEEWKERKIETSEDVSSKFMNLRFLSLELPQQENYYDCGLFLLHYVELFLKDAPVNFSPFNITKFSTFLNADWFLPSEVSLKRPYIRRLVHEILATRSQGSSRDSICAENAIHQSSKLEEENGNDSGIELISASCNPQSTSLDSFYAGPCQGIDMNLRGTSPVSSSQCTSKPGLGLRDFYEPGTFSVSLYDQYHQGYGLGSYGQSRGTMPPIKEEDDEDNTDPLYSMPSGSSLRQLDGLISERCNVEYLSNVSWDQSFDHSNHDEEDASPDLCCDSEDEMKVIEDNLERHTHCAQQEELDALKFSLVEKPNSLADEEQMDTMAEDSADNMDGTHIKREREDHLPPMGEDKHQQSSQEREDQGVAEEDGLFVNDSSSELDELQPAKRLKRTPLNGETEQEIDSAVSQVGY